LELGDPWKSLTRNPSSRTTQLLATPIDGLEDPARSRVVVHQPRIEDVVVVIAHDAAAAELAQSVDDLPRRHAECRNVAEAYHLICARRLDRSQHLAERDRVPVDVGNQGDAVHASPELPRVGPSPGRCNAGIPTTVRV
jgi:hypothetical protein